MPPFHEHGSGRFLAQRQTNTIFRDIVTAKLWKRPAFLSRNNHTRSSDGKTSLAGKITSFLFRGEDNGHPFILPWKDEGWHLACEPHFPTIWSCIAAAIGSLALPESHERSPSTRRKDGGVILEQMWKSFDRNGCFRSLRWVQVA